MDAITELIRLQETLPDAFRRACARVLHDIAFQNGVASSGHHPGPHQERGGLALHTYEVAKAARELCGSDTPLATLAITAAVFHDYGKILEYEVANGAVRKTLFAYRVGHVVWGWRFFMDTAADCGINAADAGEIGHALLAHMGRLEWRSPVTPQTRLAFILHTADMLSAKGV